MAFLATLAPAPAQDCQVTVFAASSLQTALDRIGAAWVADTGCTPVFSYAGSAALARQIEAGAPADLFVSAAPEWMDTLQSKDLLVTGSRQDFLGNALVLIAYQAGTPVEITPDLNLAGLLGDGRLATGEVDSVPAGTYAKEALTSLGLWNSVADRLAQSDSVRATLALVERGEAPLGIVYATDAKAALDAGSAIVILGVFPDDSHSPILYSVARIKDRDRTGAAAFQDYLTTSEQARAVFAEQGFTFPTP
jgi:molybdate transport system substrate-binding protein